MQICENCCGVMGCTLAECPQIQHFHCDCGEPKTTDMKSDKEEVE